MKTKIIKLLLFFIVIISSSCSIENSYEDYIESMNKKEAIKEKKDAIRNININFEDQNSFERKGSGLAGHGYIVYYRVSFYNTTSSMDRAGVANNFSSSTDYASSYFNTSDPLTQVWMFFDDDQNLVDSLISQNNAYIQEQVLPSVVDITYSPTVTEIIKEDIREDFDILIILNENGQDESWLFDDCCVSGETCGLIDSNYSSTIINDSAYQL